MDYNILYKHCYSSLDDLQEENEWDIFISAYNLSDRVKFTYDSVRAKQKFWLVHQEYGFLESQLPKDQKCVFFPSWNTESINVRNFFEIEVNSFDRFENLKICLDSTGLMRPTLMFFILYLSQEMKVKKFDILYSEPSSYSKNENTTFSKEIGKVRVVEGFETASERDTSNDLLIIGSGFDDVLIAEVAEAKRYAQIVQIVGFPSLQADMYQQNLYRASKVDEIDTGEPDSIWFAPANDPFVTANVLGEIVRKKEKKANKRITNLYLSPLSTKAQTIGFALYFINECFGGKRDASVLIPESKSYSEKTSDGIANIWRYQIELQ